jgi:hypothetical protein
MKKSCQENERIKTALEVNEEKLSRKRKKHDRFGCKCRKAVKKPKELRQL